ncbi:MAG: hypothetical protein WBE86_00610 [Candidatus Acidiferrales bacterium]
MFNDVPTWTVGMDTGDMQSCYCVLGERGEVIEVIEEGCVGTSKKAMVKVFGSIAASNRRGS